MKKNRYLFNSGELKRKDNSLIFKTLEGNASIPVETTAEIFAFGDIKINSEIISFLSQKSIIVHFFNYYGYYASTLYPREKNISGKLLVKQVEHYVNADERLIIAKEIVKGSANNIYRNIRYYNGRGKDLNRPLNEVKILMDLIDRQTTISELMGIEGNINKVYYSCWTKITNQKYDFDKRVKRPPDNIINTLISFVNSLVYATVLAELYKTHLNSTISFLHEPGEQRFSLSLDLADIFKPLLSHRLIFSLLNLGQISERHFTKEVNYLHLNKNGRKIVMQEFDKSLERTIKNKQLGKNVSYKYLIRLEAYKLIKHINGEKDYESFKMWW